MGGLILEVLLVSVLCRESLGDFRREERIMSKREEERGSRCFGDF